MNNPFAQSTLFHKLGHITNTAPMRVLPTPRGYVVITTTGAKTGRPRSRAIRAVRDGDRLYGVALRGSRTSWLANIRANPAVRVRQGTKTTQATARLVSDIAELQRAAAAYHAIAGWYDYFDYVNYTWGVPTRSNLHAAHDRWFASCPVVAFDLQPPIAPPKS